MSVREAAGAPSARPNAAVAIGADDVARPRLEAVLKRNGHRVVASAKTIAALVEGPRGETPEAIVVAFDPAGKDFQGELALARRRLPGSPIVVVAPHGDNARIRKALRAGADGYVAEAEIEHALPTTLSAVLSGQLSVPRSISNNIAPIVFSFRERQVLGLMATGLTNAEIADRLYLSESTIKSHLASSYRKLGVSSRAEAAAIVLDPDSGIELRGDLLLDQPREPL